MELLFSTVIQWTNEVFVCFNNIILDGLGEVAQEYALNLIKLKKLFLTQLNLCYISNLEKKYILNKVGIIKITLVGFTSFPFISFSFVLPNNLKFITDVPNYNKKN